jgi:hypothetical protein
VKIRFIALKGTPEPALDFLDFSGAEEPGNFLRARG